jgi:hypothetical protein
MVAAFVIELARVYMSYFQNDQKKWAAFDEANLQAEEQDGTDTSINCESTSRNPKGLELVNHEIGLKV